MNLSQNTQAILLLTGYFNSASASNTKPFTVGEWARFAEYLRSKAILPSQLLETDYLSLLDGFVDKTITLDRVDALLKRGTAMAVALEKWSRANIWVISRADKEYPGRLKKMLGHNSPPVLYGCGNKTLLNKGGIGVVGSRNVSEKDLKYTKQLGVKAAESGFSIVSGGAKGVDQAAMLAALEVEGTVIGIMADSLFRACSSHQYRQHIMNNNLVLITPFYPEAGFNAGNAMQRNKYIYCLSNSTVVVHSGRPEGSKKGGGTWTGAIENLKKQWVPLWVKQTDDVKAGNALIVQEGAHWLSDDIHQVDVGKLLQAPDYQASGHQTSAAPEDLFSENQNSDVETEQVEPNVNKQEKPAPKEFATVDPEATRERTPDIPKTFYEYFLVSVKPLLIEAKPVDELANALEINKTQLNVWLKKAVEDKAKQAQ